MVAALLSLHEDRRGGDDGGRRGGGGGRDHGDDVDRSQRPSKTTRKKEEVPALHRQKRRSLIDHERLWDDDYFVESEGKMMRIALVIMTIRSINLTMMIMMIRVMDDVVSIQRGFMAIL